MTHFRVYWVWLFVLLTFLFLLGKKLRWALFCGVIILWNAAYVIPLYFGPSIPNPSAFTLKVMSANVHTQNRQHRLFLDLVRRENPDLLLVMEATDAWMQSLTELKPLYPHVLAVPRTDAFGIALFSKNPTESIDVRYIGDTSVPSIVATCAIDGHSITILGTHTLPPVNANYARDRNRQLSALARFAHNTKGPIVLVGDLNITSWSPYFTDLLEDSGLHDTRRGFGIQATWTGGRQFLRLPIDHVLVSPELNVHDRHVGPDIGSDHQPVIVSISMDNDSS